MPHRERPLIVRCAYGAFGLVCVAVGFVGIVTPVMPGFVFLVIALWAFRNSSAKMESWLLDNRYVGQTLRDWDAGRSMKLRTKIVALCMIWVAISVTCYKIATSTPIFIKQIAWTLPKWVPLTILVGTVIWLTDFLRRVPLSIETSPPEKL
jgi:uncharacterized membrane protein YbaN (DUF454 family)